MAFLVSPFSMFAVQLDVLSGERIAGRNFSVGFIFLLGVGDSSCGISLSSAVAQEFSKLCASTLAFVWGMSFAIVEDSSDRVVLILPDFLDSCSSIRF